MHPDYMKHESQNTMATSNAKKSALLNTQYMLPSGVKVTSMPGGQSQFDGDVNFKTQVGFYNG